jgi:hypothetical protein
MSSMALLFSPTSPLTAREGGSTNRTLALIAVSRRLRTFIESASFYAASIQSSASG